MTDHAHIYAGAPSEGRHCIHCGEPQPTFTPEQSEALVLYFGGNNEQPSIDNN